MVGRRKHLSMRSQKKMGERQRCALCDEIFRPDDRVTIICYLRGPGGDLEGSCRFHEGCGGQVLRLYPVVPHIDLDRAKG